ncbi:hypothetical protein [Rothia sp. ZJ932]|uniref:hypothetical protein n=1 Tax=Rothia sp. ZJ932 TaxID=2810516 RepID=UPI0019672E9C|nr:hypothetical protein [Rothia sp. ZJ932]QRZ61562.1 hypothetical protein JR346_10205 [Rothia sp. ZJ932]
MAESSPQSSQAGKSRLSSAGKKPKPRRNYKPPKVIAGILTARDRITVRNRLLLVAFSLALVGAVVASITNHLTTNSTPEQAVNSYLRSLERGSYFSALDKDVFTADHKIFIKSAAYRRSTGRIEDHRIKDVETAGVNQAVAHVEVKVHDQWHTVDIPVERLEKEGLLNDEWQLVNPTQIVQPIEAPLPLDAVTVNGVKTDLGAGQGAVMPSGATQWGLVLLPGEYQLDTPKGSYYSLVGMNKPFSVALTDNKVESLSLGVRPSSRMWSEVDEEVSRLVKRCAEARSLSPSGCPSSEKYVENGMSLRGRVAVPAVDDDSESDSDVDERVVVEKVRWKLVNRPALVLAQNFEQPTVWEAEKRSPVVFELTYEIDGKAQRETIEAAIDARVESTGNSAKIDVSLQDAESISQ